MTSAVILYFLLRRFGQMEITNPVAQTPNTAAHIHPEEKGVQASSMPPPPTAIPSHMTRGHFRIGPY